ncbi:aldo/keto reductase [Pontivivens insulae]|uniref:Putative oxidoreductase n=1 Tax=Pontivivens insulae TaxID=1639689 RepID=A0A2R8AA62_9RHOB|nr:aldo/keto reductase [Pontivivens insulae]RED13011.1 aryl-alcohol dehydrogenase-like predicted oxidoreductase [Pontivivens insulae]SPF29103.1 putative oxidoreductase [Pontivivens insulae]
MKYNRLGQSDLMASEICLGSMTWGTQNTEAEGHAQMDMARERGVNFIDTAEMYPTTPLLAETCGRTEEIMGTWIEGRQDREDLIIATKVVGNGFGMIRDGGPITPSAIHTALEGSLKRLRCDYVDLYQMHWPNQGHFHFRRQWSYDPSDLDTQAILDDTRRNLEALAKEVDAGRIRYVGLSNDTTWGTLQWLRLAKEFDLPRVACVQNEYSLMYRQADLDFAEMAHHEQVSLISYSSLACGLLTGKYSGGAVPSGSRMDVSGPTLGDRTTAQGMEAADAYAALARDNDLDPATMAIAFCLTRPFLASVIIGATTLDQLESVLAASEIELSQDVMDGIGDLHRQYPFPF